jgi:D-sedoheptulose 7-phosphate isomerase
MNPLDSLLNNLQASIDAKQAFLSCDHSLQLFERCVVAVIDSYQSGGRLYIAGNGGSAADAQHLAAEFVSKLAHDRAPLPAEALTTDSSILTAIGNDYGFEHVFSRQLTAKLKENDIFLGITTSGRSPNILKALEVCKGKGIQSIVFTAYDGGLTKNLADICIVVPGIRTSTIQELHIVLAHTLCECVESAIFKM